MRTLMALTLAFFALVLVAVGCGGDDDDSGGRGAQSTEQPAQDGGAGSGAQVSMKDVQFDPTDVTVSAGQDHHLH
jgi:plastocyanin